MEEKKEFKKDQKRKDNKKPFKKAPTKTLDEIIVETKAVVKVTKGGRQRRFQAVVLVGDKKGLVGLGTGKAAEVSEAVKTELFIKSGCNKGDSQSFCDYKPAKGHGVFPE